MKACWLCHFIVKNINISCAILINLFLSIVVCTENGLLGVCKREQKRKYRAYFFFLSDLKVSEQADAACAWLATPTNNQTGPAATWL